MYRLTRYHALAFMVLTLLVAATLRLPDLPTAPPGLHYDEAANGILAAEIGLQGERPIFISSYTGKEPLFFYLAGGLMVFVGDTVFSLRLTAAFIGLLTIAATYWLGREMLADRRVALIAAALLAVSFWHVLFSRMGFRAISEPLLQALAVAALFRGLRRRQRRWLVVGGVFLGLTAYTYLAARLFPVLLLIASLPLLLNWRLRRLRWSQLGLYFAVALLVLTPLLSYFIAQPDAFWVRITQVAPVSAEGGGIWDSLLRSFGMFFLQGDTFWRFNLPGKPLFNWFWGGLLVLGWLVCIWRWRRYPYDWQRAALTLLVAAPLVMILPTALAVGELVPSNLRAIGLIPFIFFLPAVGLVIVFHDVEKRFHFPPVTPAVLFIAALTLLSGGLATANAYFEDWAEQEILFYESDGDMAAVASFLDGRDFQGRSIYVAAPHYQHPTLAFLSDKYGQVKWLPQSRALVFPPEGSALVVYPHNSPAPSWTEPYFSGQPPLTPPWNMPDDAFVAYELGAGTPEVPVLLNTNFGNVITLLGYRLEPAAAGDELPLTLYWQVVAQPPSTFTPFVHLEDQWGHRWSQAETFAYPSEQWAPGETIVQRVEVPVPPGAPSGTYRLRIGLFDPAANERLPRLDERGRFAGDALLIDAVPVTAGAVPEQMPQPPFTVGQQAADGLQLLGYERSGLLVPAGAPWDLALWWLATDSLRDYSQRFTLRDARGEEHVLLEGQPVHDTYPFAAWQTPQFVIDRQTLPVSVDLPAGEYRLQMALLDTAASAVYRADLGPLQIEATERQFTAPSLDVPLDATFGDVFTLLGYKLQQLSSGETDLSLVWQARQQPAADYTVFVHLLHPDGSCCAWQQDVMPQQNGYPTSRWLAGEVVVDTYRLPEDLPLSQLPLEMGLYLAESGQRLPVMKGDEGIGDALLLEPLTPR